MIASWHLSDILPNVINVILHTLVTFGEFGRIMIRPYDGLFLCVAICHREWWMRGWGAGDE